MKLLITGGHLTPALAVIDKIIESSQKIKFPLRLPDESMRSTVSKLFPSNIKK